jgi:hypothetical protein
MKWENELESKRRKVGVSMEKWCSNKLEQSCQEMIGWQRGWWGDRVGRGVGGRGRAIGLVGLVGVVGVAGLVGVGGGAQECK